MMKKALLPLAIAAVMPVSAMAMGPIDGTLYGKANVSIVNTEEKASGTSSEDEWSLNSNASRVGIKGKTELSEDLYAIYKAEFEIYFDNGSSKENDSFEQRNIYVGLSGNYGTIIAGKHDTILKLSQGKVDQFNDLETGDIKNWMSGETRASNIISYTSPSMANFSASVMTILGEDSSDGQDQDGLFDSYSLGVTYANEGLTLTVAMDENVDSGSQEKDFLNIARFTAAYKIGDLSLGAIIQSAEDGDNYAGNVDNTTDMSYDEDSYVVSAAYKLGSFTLKTQYGEGEYEIKDAGVKDEDYETEAWSFGVDYKLAKNTKLFAYYSKVEADDNLSSDKEEETSYGLGMEHKF